MSFVDMSADSLEGLSEEINELIRTFEEHGGEIHSATVENGRITVYGEEPDLDRGDW